MIPQADASAQGLEAGAQVDDEEAGAGGGSAPAVIRNTQLVLARPSTIQMMPARGKRIEAHFRRLAAR